jgi:hypothetical protein
MSIISQTMTPFPERAAVCSVALEVLTLSQWGRRSKQQTGMSLLASGGARQMQLPFVSQRKLTLTAK